VVKKFLALSPISLKFFYRRRQQHLKMFCDVCDSAKKYKTAIFKPKPSKF
jgi:hypothetical protein